MQKKCPRCCVVLPASAFNKSKRYRDGLQTYCRSCHSAMQRERYAADPVAKLKRQMRARKRKSKNPLAQREHELNKLYGLTLEQWLAILKSQGGVCAICKEECKTRKGLCVDHDHDSGRVRGLLCMKCNAGLGMFRDNLDMLRSAVTYLESSVYRRPN